MPIKEIFARAAGIYKKNFTKLFLPLLALQLVLLLPLLFFTMPGTVSAARAIVYSLASLSRTGEGISGMLYVFLFIALTLVFFSPLVVSNTVYLIDKDSRGERVEGAAAFEFSRGNYGKMVGSYFAGLICAVPLIIVLALLTYDIFTIQFDPVLLSGGNYSLMAAAVVMGLLYIPGTVFLPYIVVTEGKWGFSALFSSFKYVYANFWENLVRLGLAALLIAGLASAINWLAQLPFKELFYLYLEDPASALKEPLMGVAIVLSIAAIFVVALLVPFWYAFSFYTYKGAKEKYLARIGAAGDVS